MSDDKYEIRGSDFKSMLENGQLILPKSGLVCPRCGFEAVRAPDGQPSDSIWLNKVVNGQVQRASPLYHKACFEEVYLDWQVDLMNERVGTWIPKEQYRAPGTYIELDKQGKEVKRARSSDTPRDQPESH